MLACKSSRKYYGASRDYLAECVTLHGWAAANVPSGLIYDVTLDRQQAARTRKIDALRLNSRDSPGAAQPCTNFYPVTMDITEASLMVSTKPLRRPGQSKEALGRYWLTHSDV